MEPDPLAVTPKSSDAFFREVDDELRRDQMAIAWQRYGRWAILGLVAALLALAGYLWWQHHRLGQREERGAQLQQAYADIAANRTAAAAAPIAELARSGTPGYGVLARFAQADLLLGRHDLRGGAAKFAEIAADGSIAQPFRDLAVIRQTAAEYDALPPRAVIARLSGLARVDSPWFGSAGEMVAIAYLKLNQPARAGVLFGQIARNRQVPTALRQRAQQMAGSLGIDAVSDSEGSTQ